MMGKAQSEINHVLNIIIAADSDYYIQLTNLQTPVLENKLLRGIYSEGLKLNLQY